MQWDVTTCILYDRLKLLINRVIEGFGGCYITKYYFPHFTDSIVWCQGYSGKPLFLLLIASLCFSCISLFVRYELAFQNTNPTY